MADNGSAKRIRFVGTWPSREQQRLRRAVDAVEDARTFDDPDASLHVPWTVVANAARHYGRRCIAYRHAWRRIFYASTPRALAQRIEAAVRNE